jgi:hypothetical protein
VGQWSGTRGMETEVLCAPVSIASPGWVLSLSLQSPTSAQQPQPPSTRQLGLDMGTQSWIVDWGSRAYEGLHWSYKYPYVYTSVTLNSKISHCDRDTEREKPQKKRKTFYLVFPFLNKGPMLSFCTGPHKLLSKPTDHYLLEIPTGQCLKAAGIWRGLLSL